MSATLEYRIALATAALMYMDKKKRASGKACPRCRSIHPATSRYCPSCGSELVDPAALADWQDDGTRAQGDTLPCEAALRITPCPQCRAPAVDGDLCDKCAARAEVGHGHAAVSSNRPGMAYAQYHGGYTE